MSGNWFGQSVLAAVIFIPGWLAMGFFEKNYQVRSDVFMVWYFLGIIAAATTFSVSSLNAAIPSWKIVLALFFIGVLFGGIGNLLLFRAVAGAHNPGLPIAMGNITSMGVFICSFVLAYFLPKYFPKASFDPWSLAGALLIIIGAIIIAIRS